MNSQEKALYLLELLIELIKNGFPVSTAKKFIDDNYKEYLNLIQESDRSGTK